MSHPVAREGQQKRSSTSPSPCASRGGWARRRWGHATTGMGSGVTSERSAPQTRGLLQRLAAFRRGSGWPGCERGPQKSGNEQAQLYNTQVSILRGTPAPARPQKLIGKSAGMGLALPLPSPVAIQDGWHPRGKITRPLRRAATLRDRQEILLSTKEE